jgi:hypothetical protein
MSIWKTFTDLTRQVFSSLVYLWPVAAVIVAVSTIGAYPSSARMAFWAAGGWRVQAWPLVFPLAILAVGSVWACQSLECRPGPYSVKPAAWALLVLLGAHLVAAAWQVWRRRGARAITAGLQLFLFWLSLLSTFIGSMSVTNGWL